MHERSFPYTVINTEYQSLRKCQFDKEKSIVVINCISLLLVRFYVFSRDGPLLLCVLHITHQYVLFILFRNVFVTGLQNCPILTLSSTY